MTEKTPGAWELDFDLSKRKAPVSYSPTELMILDQVIIPASSYQDLAFSIGKSASYLKGRVAKLHDDKIIKPFYSVDRIGLTDELLVLFEGTKDENKKILDGLLKFPNVELFLTEDGGIATLKVPSHWIKSLYSDIISLRDEFNIYGMLFYPVLSSLGISLAEQAQATFSE